MEFGKIAKKPFSEFMTVLTICVLRDQLTHTHTYTHQLLIDAVFQDGRRKVFPLRLRRLYGDA